MRKTKTALAISLVLSTAYLAGCNDGSSLPDTTATNSASDATSLLGSVFKGPIDNATIQISDAAGKILATGGSQNGTFDLKNIKLGAGAYFIQSLGGSYIDEATGKPVSPGANEGLMAVFTGTELRDIISKKQYVAMTPETTIIASLVKEKIAAGMAPQEAISEAIASVKKALIDGTNPVSTVPGDEPLRIGNLATALPANQKEALARNRAISFSYEAEALNLKPAQAIEIVKQRGRDLADGKLDGIANGNPVKIQDKDNKEVDFSKRDQKASFGLARARLFNKTVDRLRRGEISESEKAELEKLGFDTSSITRFSKGNEDAAKNTAKNLAATDLPAFNRLPVLEDEDGDPNNAAETFTLTAKSGVNVKINAPGKSWVTPMLRYNGLQLPPIIKANRGDQMTLNLVNDLKDDTTIHWHGFKIPGDQDGGPDFPVAPNGGKTYSFKMQQPAAPLWFHPHPDMKTGEQVYRGLAGVFLLEDAISKKLEADKQLPAGDFDIPVLVQDRRFKAEVNGVRELAYKTLEMDSDGMMGNDVLVNGAALPKLEVSTRQYRFRIYNTSNARTYDFALNDGTKFMVVGTDGGLLPQPVETDHIMLGAAERAEIVVDFGKYKKGDKVMLISRAFNGSAMTGMGSMGGNSGMGNGDMSAGIPGSGSMGGPGGDDAMGSGAGSDGSGMAGNGAGQNIPSMDGNRPNRDENMGNRGTGSRAGDQAMDLAGTNGANPAGGTMMNGMRMDIMRFDVMADATDDVTLYSALPASADINTQRLKASDASKTRDFVMTMAMGNMGSGAMGQGSSDMGNSDAGNGSGMGAMTFVINGKSFDMNRIDELIKLSEGNTEIWSIQNMSPMAHPFHAHAIQWQILDRNGKPATGIDLGWKDTVLVQPGETVRFIGRFDPTINKGNYMYHCHILEHEDAGMMGFFRIEQ